MQTVSTLSAESAVEQSKLANKVDFAVARKILDAQKQQGQAAVELVKEAADLQKQLSAGKIDVRL